jgi:hypothetical protein
MSSVSFSLWETQRPWTSAGATGAPAAIATPATQNADTIATANERPAIAPMTELTHVHLTNVGGVRRLPFTAAVLIAFIVLSLGLPAALIALALGFGVLPLPYDLFLVLQRLPVVFPLHMVASGVALILIPIAAFARQRRGVHRAVGRMAAVAVVVGGMAALAVALASEASTAARAGFFVQGVVWLALLALAVIAIRRGERTRHACMMMAMAAVASGAIWLRLVIVAARGAALPFETVYAVAAWACWLVPLIIVLAVSRHQTSASRWSAALFSRQ